MRERVMKLELTEEKLVELEGHAQEVRRHPKIDWQAQVLARALPHLTQEIRQLRDLQQAPEEPKVPLSEELEMLARTWMTVWGENGQPLENFFRYAQKWHADPQKLWEAIQPLQDAKKKAIKL